MMTGGDRQYLVTVEYRKQGDPFARRETDIIAVTAYTKSSAKGKAVDNASPPSGYYAVAVAAREA